MIKKLINYIFNKNYQSHQDLKNGITFFIDENNKLKIRISIYDTKNYQSIENFGTLLYLINEGYYVQSILDVFSDMSSIYPEYKTFISEVINEWSNKIKNDDIKGTNNISKEKPIISPSEFYTYLGK